MSVPILKETSCVPHQHYSTLKRRIDSTSRFRSAVVTWSDITCAWMFMMVLTAVLLGW